MKPNLLLHYRGKGEVRLYRKHITENWWRAPLISFKVSVHTSSLKLKINTNYLYVVHVQRHINKKSMVRTFCVFLNEVMLAQGSQSEPIALWQQKASRDAGSNSVSVSGELSLSFGRDIMKSGTLLIITWSSCCSYFSLMVNDEHPRLQIQGNLLTTNEVQLQ